MIKPFEAVLWWFDPSALWPVTNWCCTWMKDRTGKCIHKHTLDIQELSSFTGIEWVEKYVKVEWMKYSWTKSYPLHIQSIWTDWIIPISNTVQEWDAWYCDIYYTKTWCNCNHMSPFIIPWIIAITVLWLLFIRPETQQTLEVFANIFK